MAITVSCPHCAAKMRAPEDMMGRTVKCAACQKPFALPAAAPPTFQAVAAAPPSYQQTDEGGFDDMDDGGRRRKPQSSGGMGDYLFFRRMITPLVIQVIFWIGVVAIVAGALIYFVLSLMSGQLLLILLGVLVATLGSLASVLILRIYCEILIIFFRTYDTLREIKDVLEQQRR